MIATDKHRGLMLGQLLVEHGYLTDLQLEQALAHQKQTNNTLLLGEVVQQLGMCTEEQVMEALAGGYGVPFAAFPPGWPTRGSSTCCRGSSWTATTCCRCSRSVTN